MKQKRIDDALRALRSNGKFPIYAVEEQIRDHMVDMITLCLDCGLDVEEVFTTACVQFDAEQTATTTYSDSE